MWGSAAVVLVVLIGLAAWRMPEVAAWQWFLSEGSPLMSRGTVSLTAGVRWFDDYYVVADLGGGAYAIGEPRYGQCNFSYLINGSQQALLFDTGPGVRDIRPVVRSLTRLPILAMPSHLHFDHTGNLDKFAAVALPDLAPLHQQMHGGKFVPRILQFLGFVEGFRRPVFAVTRWIRSGETIDLGDRQLQLLSVPGHTPDSVIVFDRASNRLFAGDFIYPSDIYAFLPGADLGDYARSARRMAALLDDNTAILGAHGCDSPPRVDVPTLHRSDLVAMQRVLESASTSNWSGGSGWYPRRFPINARLRLLAKYPWMAR